MLVKCLKNFRNFNKFRHVINRAFDAWQRASNQKLKFIDLSSDNNDFSVDLDLSFARGDHGCVEKLDGPGKIVAHSAYLPHGFIHLSLSLLFISNRLV